MEFKKPANTAGNRPARGAAPLGESAPFRSSTRQFIPANKPLSRVPQQQAKPGSPQPRATSAIPFYKKGILLIKRIRISKKVALIVTVLVVLICLAIYFVLDHNTATDTNNVPSAGETVQDLEYQTILPPGKSITDLGGWKRVSPTQSDPVYAYADKIGDAPITVSQQPLPKSFVGDTDNQVSELAKKFNATTKIDASGINLYVGSSAKGPQSAIFTKNSLLILIKSQEKIEDADWATYAKSLN